MAKKKRYRKPLVKKLQEDMGLVVSEIMMIKNHINDLLQPQMMSFMSLFEQYLEYKNETKEFTLFMEKEAENGQEKIINKKPKEGQKKQTKGSGTPKTSGKPS
tara:strand:- start:168 stop:476 length:309 start_codon:yes stop_codon:yes gene_type:complete